MVQRQDTEAVFIDKPVNEVLQKIGEGARIGRLDEAVGRFEYVASEIYSWPTNEPGEIPEAPSSGTALGAIQAGERAHFFEWLCAGAGRFSRRMMAGLAAAHLSLARIEAEGLGTFAIDVGAIISAVEQERWTRVTVSPDLIMPRGQVFASSLFMPSGALLTWLVLQEDDQHGER